MNVTQSYKMSYNGGFFNNELFSNCPSPKLVYQQASFV